jgi:hypothetical protein
MYPKTSNWRVIAIFKSEPKEQLILVGCSFVEARQKYIDAFIHLIDVENISNLDHLEIQQWEQKTKDYGGWKSKGTLKTPPLSKILQATSPASS